MTQQEFKYLRIGDAVYLNGNQNIVQDIDRNTQKILFGVNKWRDFRLVGMTEADSYRATKLNRKEKTKSLPKERVERISIKTKFREMGCYKGTYQELSEVLGLKKCSVKTLCNRMKKNGMLSTVHKGCFIYEFKYIGS